MRWDALTNGAASGHPSFPLQRAHGIHWNRRKLHPFNARCPQSITTADWSLEDRAVVSPTVAKVGGRKVETRRF
jgi:hypothetical protein